MPQTGAPLQTEGTIVPAAPITATPAVINVPPPQIYKYEEAESKAEEGGAPGGDIPEPEGGGGIAVHGAHNAVAADAGPPVISCSIIAWTPDNDSGGYFYFAGDIICDGAPAHLQVKVCGQEFSHGHWHSIGCSALEQGSEVGFLAAARISYCTRHEWLRTWAWGWAELSNTSKSEAVDISGEVRC